MSQKFFVKAPSGQSWIFEILPNPNGFQVKVAGVEFQLSLQDIEKVLAKRRGNDLMISASELQRLFEWGLQAPDAGTDAPTSGHQELAALFPGKVTKINVKAGDCAKANDVVLVMESMKMEYAYQTPKSIRIKKVLVSEGEVLRKGQFFFEFNDEP